MNDDLTIDQRRVLAVLERITKQVREDSGDAEMYGRELELMLDELAGDDAFGTEGQSDPRGDFRDGDWLVANRVQGVDE